MAFTQIRTRRIYEDIIQQVKAQIASGALRPGDRLMSEREIAEQLGVSRTTVREALSALEVMGLLEVRQGDGSFVRSPRLEKQLEPMASLLVLERDSVVEMYELRGVLEAECAGLAAKLATSEELEAMSRCLRVMEEDIRNGRQSVEADFNFHRAIAVGAHNGLILRFMDMISGSLRQVLQTTWEKQYEIPGKSEQLLEEHRRIYEAIRSGDGEAAKKLMRLHLDGCAHLVLN